MTRLLKLLIALVYYAINRLWQVFRKPPAYSLLGLCYHEVTAQQQARFIRQLDLLEKYTKPVFADAARLSAQPNRVAITFDDGFASLLEQALPALSQRQMPVTLFIPSGCLGVRPAWLKPNHANSNEIIMTATQLQAFSSEQVLIGSHAMNHLKLTQLSAAQSQQELTTSRQELESLLGRPVQLLAFPYGYYNQAVLQQAAQAGYLRCFAADPCVAESDFLMGRVTVSPDDWQLEFYLKIQGAYAWLPLAIAWKNQIKQLVTRQTAVLGLCLGLSLFIGERIPFVL